MKVTFPNLGNACFAAKALFQGLGIDCIIPPHGNKSALELGSLYSPEEMCLPFKIMVGTYIECIKQGADTIILVGSTGPCRFGEYCELQMNLMKKLGFTLDFIVIDSPSDIGMKEFMNRIGKISCESKKTKKEKLKALHYAYRIINLMDEIEEKVRWLSPYEVTKGECKNLLKECKLNALNCTSPKEMYLYLKNYKKQISNVNIDKNKKPLKVAIIGEIYTVMEPFTNLYIEDKLMDFGVSTKRHLTCSWWVKNTLLSTINLNSLQIKKASKEYLPYYIGGHAKECIGEAVLAKEEGFDGAIQIFPMGCMPEIVSKSILPTISKDNDFPILSLIVDEMTGEAGYSTRIEAYLDLLERRRENVLYGS
jgi:predicted nucleotide-binding protein (sugar kinase/HSP70/actin superfamily)